LTITAIPRPGYRFSDWGGIDDEKSEIILELDGDLDLNAHFIEE